MDNREIANKAENRVVQKFPERIVYLNELLKKPEFCIPEIDLKCNLELSTVLKLGKNINNCDGKNRSESFDSKSYDATPEKPLIPTNKNVIKAFEIIKPNVQQLIEDTNALKMWVSLLIPKIEDGNNFGVSVQEDTLAQIQHVEGEATSFLEQESHYYVVRAKLVTKILKNPYIEDYRRAINELDERTYLNMALTVREIRNHYSTMHDIVIKNFDKIKKPRSYNTDSFY
ncbi:Proteasome activator pa28, N-terminal domain,Proteasome activator pa28, C-terminal [Cinara cedri]|uniref:Proteasome activator pa28, N-terminal domain,Proteasome activator pa28, C-terminal n=1 Tax=Cinara cedri TaxID=506608 RepID=A0A5E4MLS5_9HEMI|nr:Proteasome activator pa28, N-terminal domain,Proteasome activator pa28, C-terminal [Cinara cedri]